MHSSNTNQLISGINCLICQSLNCADCPNSASNVCQLCDTGFYLDSSNQCVPCTAINQAVDGIYCRVCNTNYCQSCPTGGVCVNCRDTYYLGETNLCSTCLNPIDLQNTVADIDRCLSCGLGKWPNWTTVTCDNCSSNCHICSGPTYDDCSKCN